MARTLFEYKVTCNGKTVAGITNKEDALLFAEIYFDNHEPYATVQVWTKGSKGVRQLIKSYGNKTQ